MAHLLSCAVVDDDATFCRTVRSMIVRACEEQGILVTVELFSDPLDLIEDYEQRFDVIFLDVEMPRLDGLELARRIREVNETSALIFITNMAQLAIRGYEVNATDFVVKPVTYDAFLIRFARALRFVSLHRERELVFHDEGRAVRVGCSDILWIEKIRNNAVFHTAKGAFSRRDTLGAIMKELDGLPFVQVNSGIAVNLAHVSTYTASDVSVGESVVLPLSRSRRAAFVDALMDFLGD